MAILAGCAALLLRPPATWSAVMITAGVGVLGWFSARDAASGERRMVLPVTLIGIAAFAIARTQIVAIVLPFTPVGAIASVGAAIAEELFFRRLAYGWLARWGPAVAIGGTAIAFAIVHVPAYGPAALPVDLAAGIVFGWQRWASGTWIVPAVTHAAANLLQMGW